MNLLYIIFYLINVHILKSASFQKQIKCFITMRKDYVLKIPT